MTVRQSHLSAGPGQPVGAQQRRFGFVTDVHATSLGVVLIWQLHASTEVTYAGLQLVELDGEALAQTSRHSFTTHADSSR